MRLFNSDSSPNAPQPPVPEKPEASEPGAQQIETLLSLFAAGRHQEVASIAFALTEQIPQHGFGWKMLGAALTQTGHHRDALLPLQKATALLPADAGPHYNLGTNLRALGRLEESAASCRRALELRPNFVEGQNNLGFTLFELGDLEEAEACYRRALAMNPEYFEATWNLCILLLASGRYSEAWPVHESRCDPKLKELTVEAPVLPFPQWRGESLVGKSLLIWPEQGFGDFIQFIRYAPLLRELGVDRLTVLCSPPLKPLLASAAGVDTIITDPASVAPHDYWTLPMSLPLRFGTTLHNIPDAIPYLHALPQRVEQWSARVPTQGIKVGLVWKGNPIHRNDVNRSLPALSTLAALWSVPDITFVSLQKWQAEEEALEASLTSAAQPLIHLGNDIVDFADTAAIVAQLDLVICVDTAIAHLAGAIGKPCWLLLPALGVDWRWLRERSDTPWYPETMRLFRQTKPNDWTETIHDVTNALRQKFNGG